MSKIKRCCDFCQTEYEAKKIIVYIDGKIERLTINQIFDMNLNTVIMRTNGYSHDYAESVKFDISHIKDVQGKKTVWCTTKKTGFIMGSSVVSFT
jgi:pentose-5-phosphate-3-epimerase